MEHYLIEQVSVASRQLILRLRWKPNVEGHVKIVTMHILVDMDEMTFYSLEELNCNIRPNGVKISLRTV